jgi:hypothetical protein
MTDRHLMAQLDGPYESSDPFEAIAQAAEDALWSDRMAAIFDDFDAEAFGADREAAR